MWNTTFLRTLFFAATVIEWNKLDLKIKNAESARCFYKKPGFLGLTRKIGPKNRKLTKELQASIFQIEFFSNVRNPKYIFQQCKSKIFIHFIVNC